ncbi:hypothetical protein SAMD00023353_7500370 [Rosellinia necatrix]|uniref:Uncharacterized protein n=1 Tax=Rosellinia necatrix TaxID=77044 RepID=A0A1W2TTG7_ROSNE|nr:hypothetical protein SAMD00023353_7500370 [Rosellinia necatrix]
MTVFRNLEGAAVIVVATALSNRTTVPAMSDAMNMSTSLPIIAGGAITAPTKKPATDPRHVPWLSILLGSPHPASHCQRLLGDVFLSLILEASLLVSGLLHLSRSASAWIFRAAGSIAHRSIRFSKQTTCALWDSTHGRRFRKKIEYEFFTLILGGGGNNLCLVIFWPGWGILALTTFVVSVWYAR